MSRALKKNVLFFLFCLVSIAAVGQIASVKEGERVFKTYPFSDASPVAPIGRIYPYFRYDGFTNKSFYKSWKYIELENPYLNVAITPEIGGKIWGAYEKMTNFPFIYFNDVVKFRDIAMRGPWTSGGIEFNFGDIGHAPTVATPVDYFTRKNDNGSVSCFLAAYDWSSRTRWVVEVNLPGDRAYFTTKSYWYNFSPTEQSYYSWMNAGFKADGNLEFIFPGSDYIGHQGEHDHWPVDTLGRKLNFYENNNFGGYKSYHVLGQKADFYGGYWHKDKIGFVHYSPYHQKLGKKIWIWGLSRQGMIWENLLTDLGGQYVELQSGRNFNQASSYLNTPFKHTSFQPSGNDSWTEFWFPVKNTGGITKASPHGVINAIKRNGNLVFSVSPTYSMDESIEVFVGGNKVYNQKKRILPLGVFSDSVKIAEGQKVSIWVGKDKIVYDEGMDVTLSRPLDPPADFSWQTEYGMFLRAKEQANQRNYQEAAVLFDSLLLKNPYNVPVLGEVAQLSYRKGLYDKARATSLRSLAVNTYDPMANYIYGLANEKLNKVQDAKDGYAVAALQPQFRAPALYRLATIACREKRFDEAERIIGQCIQENPLHLDAQLLNIAIKRKKNDMLTAYNKANELLANDPLFHGASAELCFLKFQQNEVTKLQARVTSEMKHETYTEVALWYVDKEMWDEALFVLNLSPEHPTNLLWKAYVRFRMNDAGWNADLQKAASMSAALVFPFRLETSEILVWAGQQLPNWKWNYYRALILWQSGRVDEAKGLINSCGDSPDFYGFYLTRANLFKGNDGVVKASLDRANQLSPNNWRTILGLSAFMKEKQPQDALALVEKALAQQSDNDRLGVEYARLLLQNKQYEKCVNFMKKLRVLPSEGATGAHAIYREACIRQSFDEMKRRSWQLSVKLLDDAEKWPEELGTGEPYTPDNRLTMFMKISNWKKEGNDKKVAEAIAYIKGYLNFDVQSSQLGIALRQWAQDPKPITTELLTSLTAKATGKEKEWLEGLADALK